MTKKTVVTFKKWKSNSYFGHEIVDIKIKQRKIGYISERETNKGSYFVVTISVKKEKTIENSCSFEWGNLGIKFSSIEETKTYLKENIDNILEKHDIHFFEKEIKK